MFKYMSISSLHNLDIGAKKLNNIAHQIKDAANLTRFYTQRARCAYNDSAINPIMHCIQI